jgi:hypothetical protein
MVFPMCGTGEHVNAENMWNLVLFITRKYPGITARLAKTYVFSYIVTVTLPPATQ